MINLKYGHIKCTYEVDNMKKSFKTETATKSGVFFDTVIDITDLNETTCSDELCRDAAMKSFVIKFQQWLRTAYAVSRKEDGDAFDKKKFTGNVSHVLDDFKSKRKAPLTVEEQRANAFATLRKTGMSDEDILTAIGSK